MVAVSLRSDYSHRICAPKWGVIWQMDMQTFFELEQKLLNEHHKEYCAFTRLLLTINVACITILGAVETTKNSFYIIAFVLLVFSLLFGVLVQHRIMMGPIYSLNIAKESVAKANETGSNEPIELRRAPTTVEKLFYRLQAGTFVLAFFVLALYFVVGAI